MRYEIWRISRPGLVNFLCEIDAASMSEAEAYAEATFDCSPGEEFDIQEADDA